jgi:hypothetical protein
MMKLWLHRYLRHATPLPSAALSTVVHATLIGASVFATANARVDDVDLEEHSIARFLAPPNREAGQLPRRR